MRFLVMFVTAVCVLFLIKIRWPKKKNFFGFINWVDNKQLLDEVDHDIMNYQKRGLCYLPKPKAEADNKDTRF